MAETSITPELLKEVFSALNTYLEEHYAPGEAHYFFQKSREKILPYFHQLEQFKLTDDGQLHIETSRLDDGVVLAFAVWLQQFMKEVRAEMIGLPLPDIETLTESHQAPLEAAGFYEFFQQASELEYE